MVIALEVVDQSVVQHRRHTDGNASGDEAEDGSDKEQEMTP